MVLKIWVGKRESDILTYKYFDISITFWGSSNNRNHSYCTTERLKDNYGNDFTHYVLKLLLQYIEQSPKRSIEIHFYNNSFAYKLIKLEPILKNYIVNINSQRIFDIVRHKTLSRVWLQNTVEVPQFIYLSKHECQYDKLVDRFPHYNKFIIQKSISGGGNGTYLLCATNWEDIIYNLNNDDVFLVSPYYEKNISLNCHLIIDNTSITVFPVSKQLLRYEDNQVSYCGNQYLVNNSKLSVLTKEVATTIGYRLMSASYRGICGLDFIFANGKLMLIEINPRYQGSSYLVNAELKRLHLPSLFELNNMAFRQHINEELSKKISKMEISYESHTCIYREESSIAITDYPRNVRLFLDGLPQTYTYEDGVYLYRYLKKCKR